MFFSFSAVFFLSFSAEMGLPFVSVSPFPFVLSLCCLFPVASFLFFCQDLYIIGIIMLLFIYFCVAYFFTDVANVTLHSHSYSSSFVLPRFVIYSLVSQRGIHHSSFNSRRTEARVSCAIHAAEDGQEAEGACRPPFRHLVLHQRQAAAHAGQ